MDGNQFDRLARLLGERSTRRRITEAFAAIGIFAAGQAAGVSAGKKKRNHKPTKKCKHGKTKCGKTCVDKKIDALNCGTCGNACATGQTCVSGACQTGGCPSGQRLCNGACVDTQTDDHHCGDCGTSCGSGQCVGGECQGAVECTNQNDCGGYSYNDLVCQNGHCVCSRTDEGICQRYPDGRGSCHVCCPGGSGQCRFDEVCFYNDSPSGHYGLCNCPTGWQRCNYNPWPSGTCVEDPMRDPHKCGPFCIDCIASVEGSICCQGFCTRGTSPGFTPNRSDLCGPNCQPCNSDSICCNQGPGTEPRCIPNNHGGYCYMNI